MDLILKRLKLIVLLLMLVSMGGCRYMKLSVSLSGASTQGLNTLNVQYFQNRASIVQPGLSQNLTDALIDKCKAQTNLSIVTSAGDASFEGEISDYRTQPQTVNSNEQAATNRFSITVKVKYTNNVDPNLSFEQSFTRYEDYDSSLDLSAVEDSLSESIIEAIVEDIFNKAFVNW